MADLPRCLSPFTPPNDRRLLFTLFSFAIFLSCFDAVASGEMRVVVSQGEYRMGDRDTREDATRLATEAAKRNALEQVATYLESITVVEGDDLTREEIRTYTAGLVLVHDQQTNLSLDGDTVIITVDLTSQIDTEEVAQAILALRENEDARHHLAALKSEIDGLQQELEAATQSLAVAATTEQAQQASLQRQEILNRVQSNAMVSQAWTDWVMVGPLGYPSPWVGVTPAQALLTQAWGLYPASPHVPAAQRVIVPNPPARPPQIVVPTTQPVLPGARTTPLTLNEVSHTTPTTPVYLGNQPSDANRALPTRVGSRTFSDMRQLPPPAPSSGSGPSSGQQTMPSGSQSLRQFLEPPGGTPPPGTVPSRGRQNLPPGSRSLQSLRQFLQPPVAISPAAQPPVARTVPPQMQSPRLVPRIPYHFAPRGLGNTGRQSGTGLGRYGGGRAGGGRGGGRGR